MFSESIIHRDTIQAFLETDYCVHGDTPLTLRVGAASPGLSALLQAHRVESSTFITACNPFSQAFDGTANAQRQAALARELQQRSLSFIEGIGQHPSNQWPGEPSFLVFGLSLEVAKALGVQQEQNAIVWCGRDAVPELIVLR